MDPNSVPIVKLPLTSLSSVARLGLGCNLNTDRLKGSIFFKETINYERYVEQIFYCMHCCKTPLLLTQHGHPKML
jgi:hypothetical protein